MLEGRRRYVDEQETLDYLKESLRVTRNVHNELRIADFTDDDYQSLLETILSMLRPFTSNFQGDYYYWYTVKCRQWHREKVHQRHTYDFYDPFIEERPEMHSVRMQLALLKWYIRRRAHQPYGKR